MASAPSSASHSRYDVFLSFRGEDICKTFTSHLHAALHGKKINTFIDDELVRGEEIAPALLKEIEESRLSVVIFSQNYASSTWCLDELAHILECKEKYQQVVIPIFYGVDPSHVQCQRESYAVAFVQHEQHFKDMPDKVLKWRDALTKASKLAGFDSHNFSIDSKLVEAVVKDIVMKLNRECSSDLNGLIELESHIEICFAPQEFSSWLLIDGKEPDRSVAQDECFKCGHLGHWAKECTSGDDDTYEGRDRSSVGRNGCFRCGDPGHWVRDCPYTGVQEMHGHDQAGDEDSSNDFIVYSFGGRRSPCWEDVCFKCGCPGHWQKECPSANGGGGNDDDDID